MKAGRSWMGILACVGIALASPVSAHATPGYVTFPGSHTVELTLQGSHGYDVQVAERSGRLVELFVHKHPSTAIYLIRRSGERDERIEARLPRLGRISVRFHPVGPARREPGFFPPCNGGETVEQPGYFLGTIRFRGERSYTTVHATRAQGHIVTTAKEVCKRSIFSDNSNPKPEKATRLLAYSSSGGRTIGFSGSTVSTPAGEEAFFIGYVTEQHEEMKIIRQTGAFGAGADLAIDGPGNFPLSATATPPAPFSGSAVFQRGSGGDNAWEGDLSAILPGAGRISLAGPDFSAKLCRDPGCRRPIRGQSRASRWSARLAGSPQSMTPQPSVPQRFETPELLR